MRRGFPLELLEAGGGVRAPAAEPRAIRPGRLPPRVPREIQGKTYQVRSSSPRAPVGCRANSTRRPGSRIRKAAQAQIAARSTLQLDALGPITTRPECIQLSSPMSRIPFVEAGTNWPGRLPSPRPHFDCIPQILHSTKREGISSKFGGQPASTPFSASRFNKPRAWETEVPRPHRSADSPGGPSPSAASGRSRPEARTQDPCPAPRSLSAPGAGSCTGRATSRPTGRPGADAP